MSISKRRRFRILKRDGFRCRYCGSAAADGAELEVDHVHPRSRGGGDDPRNLVTACRQCNRGKHAEVLADKPCWLGFDFDKFWSEYGFLLRQDREATMHRYIKLADELWLDGGEHLSEHEFHAEVDRRAESDPETQRLQQFWGPGGVGTAQCAPESAR